MTRIIVCILFVVFIRYNNGLIKTAMFNKTIFSLQTKYGISPLYNGLPNSSSYGGYTNGGYNSPVGTINELTDLFNDLSFDCKPTKRPPPSYLCHLCFKKGHYIKDCPQVCIFSYFSLM